VSGEAVRLEGAWTVAYRLNDLGQPVGLPCPGWQPPPVPPRRPLEGRFCIVEPLDANRHGDQLYEAIAEDTDGATWTYMFYGPFQSREEYLAWVRTQSESGDPLFFAIVDRVRGRALGVASYMRINPEAGSIEVGNIHYSPALQRTPVATEAMYLMMKQAFDLGYRRYEWKCDAVNAKSRAAAERLGFTFEGVHRQARVYKGRNRDTAWYSVIDTEWPRLERAFVEWLDPANFDEQGRQRRRLADIRAALAREEDL